MEQERLIAATPEVTEETLSQKWNTFYDCWFSIIGSLTEEEF